MGFHRIEVANPKVIRPIATGSGEGQMEFIGRYVRNPG